MYRFWGTMRAKDCRESDGLEVRCSIQLSYRGIQLVGEIGCPSVSTAY
ncbi:uncharacterized protein METZ01_LOCUS339954 [marine metagenome]|uniref:Uncharacterized protein n=1 Tax=marine metagenome TaxID=408172 RepID=A0A382QQE7_9ZZZZ